MITEAAEFPDHLRRASLGSRFGDGRPTFLVGDAVMENLPDEATQAMGDGADGLRMSETHDEPAIHELPLVFTAAFAA